MVNINASNHSKVFNKLSNLVGKWHGETNSGKVYTVEYKLIANGSALVETWNPGSPRSAMTVYSMDNDKLMATHYCPLGNQPRLILGPDSNDNKFNFVFVSATNLADGNSSHQIQFDIEINGPNKFRRGETYSENGKTEYEDVMYERLP